MTTMLKSYFLIAVRNLRKHKIFSLVNIAGLAIGLAVFWLMTLYIADELSFDRWEPDASRIFRVIQTGESPGGKLRLAPTSAPFAPTLTAEYPEIEAATRVDPEGGGTILYQDKKIRAEDILFADSAFLHVFRLPFISGNLRALAVPGSIVLTRSLAERIFGDAGTALGKTIAFEHGNTCMVSGVIENLPANTHLSFSALRSMPDLSGESWQAFHVYTYLLLKKGVHAGTLEARLPAFYQRHLKPVLNNGLTSYSLSLQAITSIHLHSDLEYDISRNNSDIAYIYIFSAIAVLVLVIAIINYINLATARSSIRVKEVGVRKVIGSDRRQLIVLFLCESVVFTLVAALIATMLAGLLLPLFHELSGRTLSLWHFGKASTLVILLTFSLLTGLVGGVYPALFISGFRTIPALKGQQGNMQASILFRKSLVTFQFVITIVLIAGSTILYQQLHFMHNKDLGFNRQQVLSFHLHDPRVRTHIEDLKTALLSDPAIKAVSAASNPIGNNDIGSNGFAFETKDGSISATPREAQTFYVDADYLPTMQITLLKGRNFDATRPADRSSAVLINETLAKELGYEDPVGRRVRLPNAAPGGAPAEAFIIGVIKDFSIYSLQHRIQPLLLQLPPALKDEDNCYVRIGTTNIAAAISHITSTFRKFDASTTFEYTFLDENFRRQYAAEEHEGRLILAFTILAIFIACLGLFGLVTFAVEQRMKEIGIRKILGASITGIVRLVSADLIRPVVLAILIATPLAWYAMRIWLEGFAYRIGMNIWVFCGAGLIALLVATITVAMQAVRAARVPPAKTLRTE